MDYIYFLNWAADLNYGRNQCHYVGCHLLYVDEMSYDYHQCLQTSWHSVSFLCPVVYICGISLYCDLQTFLVITTFIYVGAQRKAEVITVLNTM
jgi:hypothetical protein